MISENRDELRNKLKKLYLSDKIDRRFSAPSFEEWFERLQNEELIGTPAECVARIMEFASLGTTYFMLTFLDSPSLSSMRFFANEIMGRL